jgi:hypothetical protein
MRMLSVITITSGLLTSSLATAAKYYHDPTGDHSWQARKYVASLKQNQLREELLGTWILQLAEDFVDGKWIRKYGDNPRGYFTFTQDGQVSVQFMKFPVDSSNKTDPFGSYLAYFGSFEVDEAAGTFTTYVKGALNPELVGTRQTRIFKIENNHLFIGGGSDRYRRVFLKME